MIEDRDIHNFCFDQELNLDLDNSQHNKWATRLDNFYMIHGKYCYMEEAENMLK